jgi:RNA polymerase sigma factor (sigma-70 family)
MMNPQNEIIQARIEESLKTLAKQQGEEFSRMIRPIILTNLTNKRIETFLNGDLGLIDNYTQLVAKKFISWHAFLHSIQIERNSTEWEQLYPKLITYAFQYFLRKNFEYSITTYEYAVDVASKAAEAILNSQFPYDIDSDPWVHRIVQIQCLRFMRDETRKKEIPSDKLVELNEEICEKIFDQATILQPMIEEELQIAIARAISQLSQARREVIQMKYFEELTPIEIAKRLGKSIEAVYCLQFNALKDLRKNFIKTGISLNE